VGTFIFVRFEGKLIKINPSAIAFIEARKNYSRVVYMNQESLLVLVPLKSWMEVLPPKEFVMVHRGHIVGLSNVEAFDNKRVYFGKGMHIPLGETFRSNLLTYIHIFEAERKGQPRRFVSMAESLA
jgi:DNA-binding LytR/AlgR family response regulator